MTPERAEARPLRSRPIGCRRGRGASRINRGAHHIGMSGPPIIGLHSWFNWNDHSKDWGPATLLLCTAPATFYQYPMAAFNKRHPEAVGQVSTQLCRSARRDTGGGSNRHQESRKSRFYVLSHTAHAVATLCNLCVPYQALCLEWLSSRAEGTPGVRSRPFFENPRSPISLRYSPLPPAPLRTRSELCLRTLQSSASPWSKKS